MSDQWRLLVVDFGDLSGLSRATATLLRIWLQLFHVQPRTELLHRAEAAIHHQQDCRLKLLFGRYAFVFEASSPALGKLIE